MRTRRMKFPTLVIAAVFLLSLAFQTAGTSYATAIPSGGVEIVRYTVLKDGSVFTGAVNKGDVITVQVTVLDTRVFTPPVPFPPDMIPPPAGTPVPTATLNTSSFTIPGQGNITVTKGPSVTAGGCTYTLQFADIKYTGIPNLLAFNISYTGLTPPLPMTNVSISLNQLVEFVPPPPPEPPPPPPDPKPTDFILIDARFGDGTVYAGERFLLSAVILATNGSAAVENVSVTFSPPEDITIADGASVVYVGTMGPGATRDVVISLLPGANIQEGSYPVLIEARGVNQQTGVQISAQMSVSIPVLQPERFEIFEVSLPSDLTAGIDDGMGFSTVTLVNKGRGTVANVTVEVTGQGLSTDIGRQYIGNVAGGEQKIADFILYGEVPGVIDGYIVVNYENVRGEKKTIERPFTVNVNEGFFEDPGREPDPFPPEEPIGTGPPMWLWILIGAAAVAIVAFLLVRRRRKQKAAAEAALDEIDDDD